MDNRELLCVWYEYALDKYGEALQSYVQDFWQEKYGDTSWEEFHDLDKKLKVKFYYEEQTTDTVVRCECGTSYLNTAMSSMCPECGY